MTGKALLAVLLMLCGACGTRVERAATPVTATSGFGLSAASADAPDPPDGQSVSPASNGASPASLAVTTGAPKTTASGAAGAPTRPGSTPRVGGHPTPIAAQATGGNSGTQGGPAGPAPSAQAPTARSPLVVASVGTLSGPVGGTLAAAVKAVQMWARQINARGGVNGHEVKLLTFDDGGDPARHRALVQRAVEQERAIAFVQNNELLTGQPSVNYLNAQRIPVIGLDTGEDWPYSSPMYFPQASTGLANSYTELGAAAAVAIPVGKTKLGYVTCVEADLCRAFGRMVDEQAGGLGFRVVHRSQVSLTQPDFTAECLTARNAGAEVLLLAFDTNTVGRFAASCARQSYRPLYVISASMVTDRLKDDPNLEGMVAATNVFPYFRSGTEATDEFAAAVARFGSAGDAGVALATGWVSAKLLERAAAQLPEPPTSTALLEALWAIHGDDLGGLTLPLSFTRDQPPLARSCWFTMEVENRTWKSQDGFSLRCRT